MEVDGDEVAHMGASVLHESHSHSGTACQRRRALASAEIKYKLRANFIVRLLQRIRLKSNYLNISSSIGTDQKVSNAMLYYSKNALYIEGVLQIIIMPHDHPYQSPATLHSPFPCFSFH